MPLHVTDIIDPTKRIVMLLEFGGHFNPCIGSQLYSDRTYAWAASNGYAAHLIEFHPSQLAFPRAEMKYYQWWRAPSAAQHGVSLIFGDPRTAAENIKIESAINRMEIKVKLAIHEVCRNPKLSEAAKQQAVNALCDEHNAQAASIATTKDDKLVLNILEAAARSKLIVSYANGHAMLGTPVEQKIPRLLCQMIVITSPLYRGGLDHCMETMRDGAYAFVIGDDHYYINTRNPQTGTMELVKHVPEPKSQRVTDPTTWDARLRGHDANT